MGNRPNEGYAEMTVCLYLPDGRVGFIYKRPAIEGHTAHDAGGLRFDVVEPFVEHHVTYGGQAARPRRAARHGRSAGRRSPTTRWCRARSTSPTAPSARVWGGEPEWEEGEERPEVDPEQSFARGHTEQHMAVTGLVTVGDERFELIDGLGLRDHSWGPRYWQSVWWYRWLTGNLGPDLGFALTVSGSQDGPRRTHGFLYDRARYGDDQWVAIRDVDLRSDYDADDFHQGVHATRAHRRPHLRHRGHGVVEHPAAQPARDTRR